VRGWKMAERLIAQEFVRRHVTASGRARGEAAEVEQPTLSIEVQEPQVFPGVTQGCSRAGEARAHKLSRNIPNAYAIHITRVTRQCLVEVAQGFAAWGSRLGSETFDFSRTPGVWTSPNLYS
jgi:hypothetical protein